MKSLLEIRCPHCGAQGQVKIPPVGALVIGPCPRCHEFVMVFAGAALPLNRAIFAQGDRETKRQHLMDVLTNFLASQVDTLVDQIPGGVRESQDEEAATLESDSDSLPQLESEPTEESVEETDKDKDEQAKTSANAITDVELNHFVEVDLRLLDNREYFHTVFYN